MGTQINSIYKGFVNAAHLGQNLCGVPKGRKAACSRLEVDSIRWPTPLLSEGILEQIVRAWLAALRVLYLSMIEISACSNGLILYPFPLSVVDHSVPGTGNETVGA